MESMLVKMQMIRAGTLNPADLSTEENRCLWQRLKTAMGQHNPEAEQASAMWQEINASGSGKDAKNKCCYRPGVCLSCGDAVVCDSVLVRTLLIDLYVCIAQVRDTAKDQKQWLQCHILE